MAKLPLYSDDQCPSCLHIMGSHRVVRNDHPFCHECLEVCAMHFPIGFAGWLNRKRPEKKDTHV